MKNNINELCEAFGLTRGDMADVLGIHESSVFRVIRLGIDKLAIGTLRILLLMDDLLERDGSDAALRTGTAIRMAMPAKGTLAGVGELIKAWGPQVGANENRQQAQPFRTITVTAESDMENVSDGYHTFKALYDFRLAYNALLFNEWAALVKYDVHKSRFHHDGEPPFGKNDWFIVSATLPSGQISNHYEIEHWDKFKCSEVVRAKHEYDGHTSMDVLERMMNLL